MAVTADRVVVELEARLNRYEVNIARAEQKFDRAMAGIQKSASRTEAIVSRAAGVMGSALAGVSVLALARGFLDLADQAKNLDAQLRLATAQSGTFAQAQEDVRRIAAETRSGLEETAKLYGNFQRNARELGITQIEAARATETVSKTFKISGADAVEASQGTRQLVQALQSGVLRGDEFNSIMENSPRLSRLLADSLGVPVKALREMAEEGELTSDKLVKAFTDKRFTAAIDAEFRELPVTFDQAMTLVHNAAVITFGAFDQGGEFSTALANFITQGSDGFEDLEKAARALGTDIRSTLAGLSDAFQPMLDGAMEAFGMIEVKSRSLSQQVSDMLGGIDSITGAMASQEGIVERWINDRLWGGNGGSNLKGRYDQGQQRSQAGLDRKAAIRENQSTWWYKAMESLQNEANAPSPRSSSGGAKPKKGRTPRSPLNPEAFAREEAALNDQILRLKADEITNTEERALAELKRLEAAHTAATTEVKGDKRYTDAQRQKIVALMGTVNALEQAKVLAERDIAVARDSLDIRMAELRNDQDFLRIAADLSDSRTGRRDAELRLLDLAYQMERAELEALIASKEATEAQKQIAEQRLRVLGALQDGEAEGVNRRFESPLERYRRELGDPDRTRDEVESAVIGELEAVRDSISSGVQKALGVKNPILAALINSFIEQQLIKPFLDSVSGASGGGDVGGIIGSVRGFLGFASGGSMTLNGRGGTDTNTLSLNGRPIANVSRGETLNVGSKALNGRGGGTTVISSPQFDLRGAVMTRELYADMERISQANAARASGAAYAASQQTAPATFSKYSQLKG